MWLYTADYRRFLCLPISTQYFIYLNFIYILIYYLTDIYELGNLTKSIFKRLLRDFFG